MKHSNQELNFDEFVTCAKSSRYLVLDTEGYQYKPHHWKPMGFALGFRWINGFVTKYFSWEHPFLGTDLTDEQKTTLKDLIESHPCIVMHNAKHDIKDMMHFGVFIKFNYRDTMLMVHDINENLLSKTLDFCCTTYGVQGKQKPQVMKDVTEKLGWEFVPLDMLATYCMADVYATGCLFEAVEPQWEKENYPALWTGRDAQFGQLVRGMEDWGIRIHRDLCEREISRGELEMGKLIMALGYHNPASSRDLAQLLLNELKLEPIYNEKTGRLTFDKKAMKVYDEELSALNNPTAKHILAFRGWSKTVSSNYRAYLRFLSDDGRLRCSFKLHGTVNDRMSCAEPNLQQIPRRSDKPWNGNLKAAFIPEDGYTLVEADYSNLEFRLSAVYAKDQGLLDIFNSGEDVFAALAAILGWERQKVKTFIYMTLFGAGIGKIAREMDVTLDEAEQLRKMFFSRYRGMRSIIDRAKRTCLKTGVITLWSGRHRHFENPKMEQHKAFNSLIQGGGAGIVKSAMLRLNEVGLNNNDCRMLLQIHDSVVFEIKNELVGELVPCIENVMSNVEPIFDSCKFPVKAKVWGSE